MRVASAPVSFGVDEVMMDDAWMPTPDDMLDWMVDIGTRGRSSARRASSAMPVSSASASLVARAGLHRVVHAAALQPRREGRCRSCLAARNLKLVRDGAPAGSQPLAILSDHFDEPDSDDAIERTSANGGDRQGSQQSAGEEPTSFLPRELLGLSDEELTRPIDPPWTAASRWG
jgi:hypothetical protein